MDQQGGAVRLEIRDKVAYVALGAPDGGPMTVLDRKSLAELEGVVEDLHDRQRGLKGAVFHSVKERCFLAGADIKLIDSMGDEAEAAAGAAWGQRIFDRVESLKVPTVSCVHGVCLGGGAELVLATDRVLMADDEGTRIGLPEVKLGLIPGFGGTLRLPVRTGLPFALDLILSGRAVGPREARARGLADETYPRENLLRMAPAHFGRKAGRPLRSSLAHLAVENFLSRRLVFQKARERVLKKTRGFYQAPLRILDVMEAGTGRSRGSYLQSESLAFGELCMGEQSRHLRRLFFMTEEAKRVPGRDGGAPAFRRGACVGAGVMGGGIAWLMASNGMRPILKDADWRGCETGLAQASGNFARRARRERWPRERLEGARRSIQPQLDYDGFRGADLVVEAVVEDMAVKREVLAEVERSVRGDAVIATNTSSLSVAGMAEALERPGRFAGLHFFNPVHRMPLVEVVEHPKADPATVDRLRRWAVSAGKIPVVVRDGPGFLVNRVLMPYLNEAGFLLEEGASPKAVDRAAVNFGMPMGPLRLLDEVGVDVALKVSRVLRDGLGERAAPSGVPGKMAGLGLLGRKSSKGFYRHDLKGREPPLNEAVRDVLPSRTRRMREEEIQERLFLPMVNEAAHALADGVASDAATVDLALILGAGFPPFRGGLLRHADSVGAGRVLGSLRRLAESVSPARHAPAPLLADLAGSGGSFHRA